MATFVLIHGMWHGPWCWEEVTPILTASGHAVLAVDLPGMRFVGDDVGAASLTAWTDHVTQLIVRAEQPVILVGHSRGGLVVSQVAERVPGAIHSIIYVAATLLPSGSCIMDVMSTRPAEALAAVRMSTDGSSSTLDPAMAGALMYNCTEPAVADRMISRMVPDPTSVALDRLQLTDQGFGSVRRCYVECLRDNTLDIALQRSMQAVLPCSAVATLDTDHSPFASDPQGLARNLIALGHA